MTPVFAVMGSGEGGDVIGNAEFADKKDFFALNDYLKDRFVDIDDIPMIFEFLGSNADRRPDLVCVSGSLLAASDKALSLIGPLIRDYSYEMDGVISGTPYKVFLPLYRADMFDYATSAFMLLPENKIMSAGLPRKTRPVKCVVPIFHLRHTAGLYCNETFAQAVEANRLTGLYFLEENTRAYRPRVKP